jgi:hypothetical protein
MGFFQRLAGTVSSFFQIGNAGGPGWNDNAGALEAKDPTNTTFTLVRAAVPTGPNDVANKTYTDTAANHPFPTTLQFDGNNPLPANTGTNQYYVVSTSGPHAVVGQLIWDNGTGSGVAMVIPEGVGNTLVTVISLSGGFVTFSATSVYVWTGAAWVNVGTAQPAPGAAQVIQFGITTAATTDSVTSIPVGAVILRATLNVTTAYSPGATIEIGTNTIPNLMMSGADNDPQVLGTYDAPQLTNNNSTSVVQVTIAGAPAAGTATVMVEYVVTPNA